MKYECDIIEDLLPLYKDKACSAASSKAVEEHLAECPKCTQMLNALKDTVIDEMIVRERDEIIDSQSRFFKRRSAVIGSVLAAIFALPILICMIVDLASGNGLGWFFIVLAAMLIPTSIFVVPLMAPKNKMFLTMCSFTASVIVLLAVCCIYTRGNWFFIAASSVLFGLSVCFVPFIVCRRPVNAYLKNFKGLAAMTMITATFFLMMICIGIHVASRNYFILAFGISVPLVFLVWIIFLIIRYMPANGFVKAGTCVGVISIASFIADAVTTQILVSNGVTVYSDYSYVGAIIGVVIGVILITIGLVVKKGNKEND